MEPPTPIPQWLRDHHQELKAEREESQPFDLSAFLRLWYPEATGEDYLSKTGSRGTLYRISQCPFNIAHQAASLIQWEDTRTIYFRCFHRSCSSFSWTDFVDLHRGGPRCWQTELDPNLKYQLYLNSPEWREFRDQFLAENSTCRDCEGVATEVHHQRYPGVIYRESDPANWQWLVPVCSPCHRKKHPDKH